MTAKMSGEISKMGNRIKKIILSLALIFAVGFTAACGLVDGGSENDTETLSEQSTERNTDTSTDIGDVSEPTTDGGETSESVDETDTSGGSSETESKPKYEPVNPIEDGGDYGFNK